MGDLIRRAFEGREQTVSSARGFPEFWRLVRLGDDYGYVPETREFFLLGPSGKRMRYAIYNREVEEAPVRRERALSAEDARELEGENWMDVQRYEADDFGWRELGFSDPNNWLVALKEAAKNARETEIDFFDL